MNADGTDPRWRAMLAALLDDDARAVLSETAAPVTGRRRERAITRLETAGLLDRRADTAEFRSDVVRGLLASRAFSPERTYTEGEVNDTLEPYAPGG